MLPSNASILTYYPCYLLIPVFPPNLTRVVAPQALLNWVGSVKSQLNSSDTATDVTTAELLLKAHQDLGDDIKAHEDEFREIQLLGEKLGAQGDVREKVREGLGQGGWI